MIRDFFTTDSAYKDMLTKYNVLDGIIAILLYAMVLASYFVMGSLYAKRGIYLGVLVNLFLALLCIFVVWMRKQKIYSIGLTMKNFKKSLLHGLIFGFVFFCSTLFRP